MKKSWRLVISYGLSQQAKCSNLVECVDFSDLTGATVRCLCVFPNNNIDLKCSFVRY